MRPWLIDSAAIILTWLCVRCVCLCTREKQKCLTLIYYTDMTEINTTLSANGVFLFLFFFQALQFSFNTAIRGPSKFTRGFVFFTLLSFFFSFFFFKCLYCCRLVFIYWCIYCVVLLSVHIHRWAGRRRHLIQEPADVTGDVHRALLVHLDERIFL